MKVKKILALILSLTMISSILTVLPVSAEPVSVSQKATISFDYLGMSTGNKNADIPVGTSGQIEAQSIPTNLAAEGVGKYIWVGVKMSGISNITGDVLKTAAGGTNQGGMKTMTLAMSYDSTYLEPITTTGVLFGTKVKGAFYPSVTAQVEDEETGEMVSKTIYLYKTTVSDLSYSNNSVETLQLTNPGNVKDITQVIEMDDAQSDYFTETTPRMFHTNANKYTESPYVAIFGFKIKSAPTPGTKVLQGALGLARFTIGAGWSASEPSMMWVNPINDDSPSNINNLKNYFNIVNSAGGSDTVVDLFPASASDYLDSIAVSGTLTKLLGSYIEGNKLQPAGITVTPHKTEGGNQTAIEPTNADFKDLKFYVDDADKTAATLSTTRELTTTTKLATTDNNKHVYVSYTLDGKTAIADLGAITVAAKSVSSITNQSTGDNKTTFGTASAYYTGTAIKELLTGSSAEKLTVVKGYNNGDTEEIVYSAFGTNGLAFYYVDANGKLQLVGDQTALVEGTNTFYVSSETDKANSDPSALSAGKYATYTITAVTDTMILKTATPVAKDLIYTEDTTGTHTINFADVVIGYNMTSAPDTTPTTKKVSEIGSSKLIFYTGTTDVPANNKYTTGTTINGTEYDADTMADKYVFVVPAGLADYTSVTPVLVGQLKDRAISTSTGDVGTGYTVTGITTDANTQYGAKLGNGAKINVKYDNGDTKEIAYADFETEGITMKIVKADGTTEVVASATDQTVLTPAMNGGYVQFYYDGTLIGKSAALTVNKKTVGYSSDAVANSPKVEKEYDGTTKLAEVDEAKVAFKIDENDLVDNDLKGGKLDITGVTYSYNSKNVADADTIVASETTPATATTAGSLAVKASTSGTAGNVTKFNENYVLKPLTANTTVYTHENVKITAKTLNVTSITGVPSVEVGATTGLTGTSTLTLKNNSDTDTNSNIVKGDGVTLTYKYEYNAADVKAVGTPDVTITATGTEGSTQLGLSGTDAGNYKLGTLPTTKGTVVNKKLNTITINTAPTKATYTYPDTKLDLTGIKFNLNYEGATTATTIDLAQFITDGGIITLTDAAGQSQTITADNAAGKISLPYGETTLNIAYGGKTTTTKVTTNKKPIKLSEITFAASKVFGQDNTAATKTATPPTGAIEAADADAVQFTFDAAFADESAGNDKNVTISNVKLVKKGEGTNDPSVNYVIVNDDGTPIATDATTTINTGVISQGTQTAPDAPTISVDPATNNIIVGGPLGENIEYSIDGGQTWQSDVTFTGLTKGQPYTVKARVKATADGNYAPSEPTASEPVTTYKYHVAIYKKNAKEGSEPAYEVYTNTTSVASKAELNALLPKKISNLKEFFTDLAATIKVEYPYTLAAENVFYYTTSSGGGGGGGPTVTITLDKTSVSGEVGNSEKVTATIKGSTATPKWTSSDEKVATVDQNGNITFVGEGKATVKINVGGTVKNVAVTVTEAKATPIPTVKPTVEPTNKPTDKPSEPIIDVNYTKPYASGYEDDTFRPENKITRAELAAMIARLSYGDDLPDGAYVSSFPDVEADAWFNKYVGYLEDKDVLNGYEDGTFRPYDTVTRGEISTVIARAQRYELITYSGIFADVTDSDWAKDYIQTLASQGIISGYEDGTFGPYSPLSRAEAVTIINNVLAPSTPIVTFTPNDIAGHWAEANIILAVNERMLGGAAVPVPVPEDTAPEATEVPAEEVVPEGELDPTVKDEPAVPVNPEAGAVTDEEQKFIVK